MSCNAGNKKNSESHDRKADFKGRETKMVDKINPHGAAPHEYQWYEGRDRDKLRHA